jgi:hypothetical protein
MSVAKELIASTHCAWQMAIVTLATKFVMLQDFFDAMEHTT